METVTLDNLDGKRYHVTVLKPSRPRKQERVHKARKGYRPRASFARRAESIDCATFNVVCTWGNCSTCRYRR